MSQVYDRFKDAKWFNKPIGRIIVGGAGGIGSWLSLFLVRNKFSIILYDFDRFEEHNIGGQLVKSNQVGEPKVDAVKSTVIEFTDNPVGIYPVNEKYDKSSVASQFMMSAFDNMEARKVMFSNWIKYVNETEFWGRALFIDGRLAAESFEVYCIQTPEQAAKYEKEYLFDDKDSSETLCTLKQTTHVAAMIAGYMTSYLTNYIANMYSSKKVYHVPFKSVHYLQLGMYTVEKK